MNKEIRVVDHERGIIRCTTVSERWYAKSVNDLVTGLPTYDYVPSVTWITSYYPHGIGFYKWLASKGWDEAQAEKELAGERGTRVHQAVSILLSGGAIKIDDKLADKDGNEKELTVDEYEAVLSFALWFERNKPTVLGFDLTVWNLQEGYAGTLDIIYTLGDGYLYLDDFKTSKDVYPSHKLQVCAYAHSDEIQALIKQQGFKGIKSGILQLGYKRNKDRYKHTPVEDCFDLFLSTKKIWAEETAGQKPHQKDLPLSVSLNLPEKKVEPASMRNEEAQNITSTIGTPTQAQIEFTEDIVNDAPKPKKKTRGK